MKARVEEKGAGTKTCMHQSCQSSIHFGILCLKWQEKANLSASSMSAAERAA